MKVKITNEAKEYLTVAEMPAARQIIQMCREDECLDDYARMAAGLAIKDYSSNLEILKAEAEIARNDRADNNYFEGSGKLDVYFRFYILIPFVGFYEIGAYLTELWQKGASKEQDAEIRRNMYILEYKAPKI